MALKLFADVDITVICIVRKQEQVDILSALGQKYIADSSKEDFKQVMAKYSAELNPTVALDAIAGEATGELLTFMGMNSTVIVYGLLSYKNSTNIDPLFLMGRD